MSYLPENYPASRETVCFQQALQPEAEGLWAARDDLLAQLDLWTATWGLDLWEAALGLSNGQGLDLDTRRLTVAAKLQGRTATTPQMIKEVAETLLGVPVEVIEIFDEYTVMVSTPAGYLPRARAVRLRAQLRDIIPAHLDFQVVIPAAAEAAVALALGPRFSGAALAPYRPDIPPVAMGWTCVPWGVCSVTTLPQAKTEEDMEWVIKS